MKKLTFLLLFAWALSPIAFTQTAAPAPKKDKVKQPTVITADKGSFFGESKNAELIGSVTVDDGEILLTCSRMLIISDSTPKVDTKPANTETDDDNMFGIRRGSIERIECHENVEVIRKFIDPKTGDMKVGQRAKAQKAFYYVKTNKIVLFGTPRPVVRDLEKGKITGDELVIDRTTRDVTGTRIIIETDLESNNVKAPGTSPKPAAGSGPRTTF